MDERDWERWQIRTDYRLEALDEWRDRVERAVTGLESAVGEMINEEKIAAEITRRLRLTQTATPRRSWRETLAELSAWQKAGALIAGLVVATPAAVNFLHTLFGVGHK